MATTSLGNLRFRLRGQYDGGTAYAVEDIVWYNGKWYRCILASTGNLPTNGTYWTAYMASFNWRGEFNNSSTAYVVGDVVKYETTYNSAVVDVFPDQTRTAIQVYYCNTAHTTNGTNTYLPGNSSYWTLISRTTHGNENGTWSSVDAAFTEDYGTISNNAHQFLKHMNDGIVGDTSIHYQKGTNHCRATTYDRGGFITRDGQCRVWGLTTNESSGTGYTVGTNSTTIAYHLSDFFRSTSNGGAGVHSTPDNTIPKVVQWETNYDWNCILLNNGEVYHWGYGGNGESGDRSTSSRRMARVGGSYTETAVALNTTTHVWRDIRIKRISCSAGNNNNSSHHCMALDEDGQVWTWGYNGYGQLGIGSTTSQNIPQLIPQSAFNNNPVVAIWAAGDSYGFSFALDDQNRLYAWGRNNTGQLGIGTAGGNVTSPTEVTTRTWTTAGDGEIRKLITTHGPADRASTAILTSAGNVFCAGDNASGHFMLNNTSQQNSFTVQTSGPGSSGDAENIFFIGGGQYGAMYVISATNGQLYAAGNNSDGVLGVNSATTSFSTAQTCVKTIRGAVTNLTNVKLVTGNGQSTSTLCAAVVTNDGFAFAAGRNNYGQLSIGQGNSQYFSQTDPNGYEADGTRAFYMVRMPPSMIGNVDSAWYYGYSDTSSTNYGSFLWVGKDGRTYTSGYYSSFSQTGQRSGTHYYTMQPVAMD